MTHNTGNRPPLALVPNADGRSSDRAPKKAGRYTLGQKIGATVATAVVAGYGYNSLKDPHVPTPPKAPEHSISYLNSDPMKKVTVQDGDNGTGLAERINGGRLSGQALLDAAQYVQNQGSSVLPGVNGEPDTHMLYVGDQYHHSDVVEVPILGDQQIADVNSGKIK